MSVIAPNELSLEELRMPFTDNRASKAAPRLLSSAKGMYYTDVDGNQILDGPAGLWWVNAGHCREPIVAAIQKGAATATGESGSAGAGGTWTASGVEC